MSLNHLMSKNKMSPGTPHTVPMTHNNTSITVHFLTVLNPSHSQNNSGHLRNKRFRYRLNFPQKRMKVLHTITSDSK